MNHVNTVQGVCASCKVYVNKRCSHGLCTSFLHEIKARKGFRYIICSFRFCSPGSLRKKRECKQI